MRLRPLLCSLLCSLPLLGSLAYVPAAHAQSAGKTVVVNTPTDPWQARRRQTLEWVRTANNQQLPKAQRDAAYQQFDAL